jgi:adenine-specific DNA-methyltransferase
VVSFRRGHGGVAEWLLWLNRQPSVQESQPASPRAPLVAAYFEQWINALIYELFFAEELHAADIRLFDLFPECNLSSLDSVPNLAAKRLDFALEELARLSRPGHPLRISLERVQTLDLVRTIEGKQ